MKLFTFCEINSTSQELNIKCIIYLFSVPPSVTVGNQLVGCPIGEKVSLKCFVEAFPTAISYWTRKSNKHEYKDELLLEG